MLNLMRQCLKVPKVKVDLSAKITHIRVPPIHSTVFSESTRPMELKFHMKTPYDRLAKNYTNRSGHMTRWCYAHIRYKPFKYLFFWNQKDKDLGTWYVALGMWALQCLH